MKKTKSSRMRDFMHKQKIIEKNIPSQEEFNDLIADMNNLEYHNTLINKSIRFLENIPSISSIFILGSLSNQTGDVFSDIDLYLMVKDEDEDEISNIQHELISNCENLGELIHFVYSMANKKDLIFYFKPFIKLEIAIRTFSKVSKLWRVGQKSKLLFDRENWGNIALEKAKKISFRFESYEFEVENFAIALPGLCYIVAGYLVRKEYITSMDFVAWIRRNMMRISGFLLDLWDEGTRRAEKRFPNKINHYYRTIKIDSIEDLWKSLEVILEWFSVFIVPRLEERGIPHALKEVALIKATIKKLYSDYA